MTPELIKYDNKEISKGIASILNNTAKTAKYPQELKKGILILLPKPNKAEGPPANCRPAILLSTLRKILTMIMFRRTMKKMQEKIPLTQAAYLPGRGTTEQVFVIKIMAEKVISANYEINVLLLDMLKAFDTIERDTLINDLKQVLEPDELHIFYLLLKDVEIQVRVKKKQLEKPSSQIWDHLRDTQPAHSSSFSILRSV